MNSWIKVLVLLLSGIILVNPLKANPKIEITIHDFALDSVELYLYKGDKANKIFTINRSSNGLFRITHDTEFKTGVYVLRTSKIMADIQFVINKREQSFKLEIDGKNWKLIKASGSKDNEELLKFFTIEDQLKLSPTQLAIEVANGNITEAQKTQKLETIQDNLNNQIQTMLNLDADYVSKCYAINFNKIQQLRKYESLSHSNITALNQARVELLTDIEFQSDIWLRTPFLNNYVNNYMDKMDLLDYPTIDTLTTKLFEKMYSPKSETFEYYIEYYLKKYRKSRFIEDEKKYITIAEEYVHQNKCIWMDKSEIEAIYERMELKKHKLIGAVAPDITTYDRNGKEVRLMDIKAEITILNFWRPDCSHCVKGMPDIIKLYNKYKDKGLKVVTVCTRTGERAKVCWEGVDKENMGDFINTIDPDLVSNFINKYEAHATPFILILDKDKKILNKWVWPYNLDGEVSKYLK